MKKFTFLVGFVLCFFIGSAQHETQAESLWGRGGSGISTAQAQSSTGWSSDGTTATTTQAVVIGNTTHNPSAASTLAGGAGAAGDIHIIGTLDLAVNKPLYFTAGLTAGYIYGDANAGVLIPTSTSQVSEVKVGGLVTSDTTVNGSGADTTEDTLTQFSFPASSLLVNGRGLRVTAWGDGVSTTDATTIKCYFGATVVATKVLTISQANTWRASMEIVRTGAATQVATGTVMNGGTVGSITQSNTSPGATLTGAVVIKCTGQRTITSSANSLRQLGLIVEFI